VTEEKWIRVNDKAPIWMRHVDPPLSVMS
jgi:hypothetical protein